MEKKEKWIIIRMLTIAFALMFSIGSFAYAGEITFEGIINSPKTGSTINTNGLKGYLVEFYNSEYGVSDHFAYKIKEEIPEKVIENLIWECRTSKISPSNQELQILLGYNFSWGNFYDTEDNNKSVGNKFPLDVARQRLFNKIKEGKINKLELENIFYKKIVDLAGYDGSKANFSNVLRAGKFKKDYALKGSVYGDDLYKQNYSNFKYIYHSAGSSTSTYFQNQTIDFFKVSINENSKKIYFSYIEEMPYVKNKKGEFSSKALLVIYPEGNVSKCDTYLYSEYEDQNGEIKKETKDAKEILYYASFESESAAALNNYQFKPMFDDNYDQYTKEYLLMPGFIKIDLNSGVTSSNDTKENWQYSKNIPNKYQISITSPDGKKYIIDRRLTDSGERYTEPFSQVEQIVYKTNSSELLGNRSLENFYPVLDSNGNPTEEIFAVQRVDMNVSPYFGKDVIYIYKNEDLKNIYLYNKAVCTITLDEYVQTKGGETITELDRSEGVNVDIDRTGTYKDNAMVLVNFIKEYVSPFLAFVVLIAVIVIGFKAIGNSLNQNAKERMELMESFKNVMVGVLIVTFAIGLTTISFNVVQKIGNDIAVHQYKEEGLEEFTSKTEPKGGLGFFNSIGVSLIKGARELLSSILGYERVENLIINPKAYDEYGNEIRPGIYLGDELDLNENVTTTFEEKLETVYLRPFNKPKFEIYTKYYWMFTWICLPLMFIAILKMGFMYIIHSTNYQQVAQVKEDAKRFLLAGLFIVLGPYLYKFLLQVFNMLVMLIPFNITNSNILRDMNTGHFLGDLIAGFWFLKIEIQIVFIFLVREVMLTVMYLIMPIVAFVWAISNHTRIMKIWMGEVFSNVSTQLVYALVFFVACIGMSFFPDGNWVMSIVWMQMVISLARAIKDSLQPDYFGTMSGVQEEQIAEGTMGRMSAIPNAKPIQGIKAVVGGKISDNFDSKQKEFNPDGKNAFWNAVQTARGIKNVMQGKGNFKDFNWKNGAVSERQGAMFAKNQEFNSMISNVTGLSGDLYEKQFTTQELKDALTEKYGVKKKGVTLPQEEQTKLKLLYTYIDDVYGKDKNKLHSGSGYERKREADLLRQEARQQQAEKEAAAAQQIQAKEAVAREEATNNRYSEVSRCLGKNSSAIGESMSAYDDQISLSNGEDRKQYIAKRNKDIDNLAENNQVFKITREYNDIKDQIRKQENELKINNNLSAQEKSARDNNITALKSQLEEKRKAIEASDEYKIGQQISNAKKQRDALKLEMEDNNRKLSTLNSMSDISERQSIIDKNKKIEDEIKKHNFAEANAKADASNKGVSYVIEDFDEHTETVKKINELKKNNLYNS